MSAARRAPVRGVTVAIASWNGRAHLELCLDALAAQRDPGCAFDICVLDNGSTDGSVEWLATEHPRVRVIALERNVGFAAAANRLVEASEHPAVALLNNDTRPEPGWLAALVDALSAAPPRVRAVSGLTLDWEGERLDTAEGILTFDGHAFQRDHGRLLSRAHLPADGEELFFPTGGNMIVERDTFLEMGGFDAGYFAYLEDVDLGWRLWARGLALSFAADARVRHRSGGTSERLGRARRGFLFERNAFLTMHRNYDAELWPRMMPAALLTLTARVQTLMVGSNSGGELLTHDPYAHSGADEPPPPASGRLPTTARLGAVWRTEGLGGLARKSVEKVQVEAMRVLGDRRARRQGVVELGDPRTIAHLQAVSDMLRGLDASAEERVRVQEARVVPDREIFERFPLHVVPTYPGDDHLFASPGFRSWLPEDLPIVHAHLDDIREPVS